MNAIVWYTTRAFASRATIATRGLVSSLTPADFADSGASIHQLAGIIPSRVDSDNAQADERARYQRFAMARGRSSRSDGALRHLKRQTSARQATVATPGRFETLARRFETLMLAI